MTPDRVITEYINEKIEIVTQPTLTHKMHVEEERVYGHTDDLDALKQMIYKCINTEKGVWPIYPSFGLKKRDLFGKPKNYAYLVLTRRIEEALMLDDRVTKVYDFEFVVNWSPDDLLGMSFKVDSIYGIINVEEVLTIGEKTVSTLVR